MWKETVVTNCDICLADIGEEHEGEQLILFVPAVGLRQLDVCADYHGALAGDLPELARKYGNPVIARVTPAGRLYLGAHSKTYSRRTRPSQRHEPGGPWARTSSGNYRCLVPDEGEDRCLREFKVEMGLKKHQSMMHGLTVT